MRNTSKREQGATARLTRRSTRDDLTKAFTQLRPAAPRIPLTTKVLSRLLLAVILLVNVAWISGFWVLNRDVGVPEAQTRLASDMARIEALLAQPDVTSPTTLSSLEAEFVATTADLKRLDGLLPFDGEWPFGSVTTEHHLLQLAMDSTQTAQNMVTAYTLLQPIAQGAIQSLLNAGVQPDAAAQGTPLDVHTINEAQLYVNTARQHWQAAQLERTQLTTAAVGALHLPMATIFLRQYDHLAPTLSSNLELASSLLDWSPGALGVLAPDHFLVLVTDSADLRPGGGRVWDYADLETHGGGLVSGIQLHSAQSLDCPQSTCGVRPIPQGYAWFPLDHNQFGLTDVALNPNLSASAAMIETMYELETKQKVDGIILVTPGIFARLLRVVGPVVLGRAGMVVSSTNVEAILAAEHEKVSATSAHIEPDIEAQLTQAILAKTAHADAATQGELAAALGGAIQSKDIRFFANSPRVEVMLGQLGMAGIVESPAGDTLLVSDTNVGLAANNPLVKESIADRVTLKPSGEATHALTITYTFDANAPWSGPLPLQPYRDLVRVVVPKAVTHVTFGGTCAPVDVSTSGLTSGGCQFTLNPGETKSVTASWTVPAAVSGTDHNYSLLLQRQPGAYDAVAVTLIAPSGMALTHARATAGALTQASTRVVAWSADPIAGNTLLSAVVQ